MPETGRPDAGTDTPARSAVSRERAVAVVAEQEVRDRVVGDEGVEAPIVIVVGERDAHPLADVREQARARRDVLERPVAAIAIQPVRQALEEPRDDSRSGCRAPDRRSSDWCPATTARSSRRRDPAGRRCRSRTSRRRRPTRRWRCPARAVTSSKRAVAAIAQQLVLSARPRRRDRRDRRCRSRPRRRPWRSRRPLVPAASVTSVNRISPSLR